MARVLYSNEAALQLATELDTALINCVLNLYKTGLVIGPSTTNVQLNAAVADFGGYAPITVAALLAPYIDPAGGASTNVATRQFKSDGTGPANSIAGAWVEDAGGTTRLMMEFTQQVPMDVATDAIPLDVIFNFRN